MKGTKGKWKGWAGLLLVLVVVPSVRAVLFEATGDPTYNTNAPTGSLTNSGWEYEGQWGVYLGTPIAPTFFLAAQHIGGSPGQPFVFNGFTYTTVTNFDDPSTDLRIWQVGETFPYYAPVYTGSSEVGKLCVVIGRGTQRGEPFVESGVTNGWLWGTTDNVERWGENTIYNVAADQNGRQYLMAQFNRPGIANECDLSVGDSSGGMFIEVGTTWELAGIHYAVDGPYSVDGSTTDDFDVALFDVDGLYDCGGGNCVLQTNSVPSAFYSTRVSVRVSWINGILNASPTAVFSASSTNGTAPLTVTFADSSTGPITNRFWRFGDGSTTNFAVATNPTHTYTAGVYNVTLAVSGHGGSSTGTLANLIGVYAPFAWWQQYYFGCTNCAPAQPNADPYGTGMSNTNKFLVGFNPTNAAAYLHVISIATTNTTDMNVIYLGANGDSTWSPGIASRTNVLEFTAGWASGGYSNNFASTGQTNILSGGTGTGIVTNMVDAGGATNTPSRYYRVRVLLP
jgi:PKD repeat protein